MYIAFIGAGAGVSSWLSRIPQVSDELELTPAALGVLLLMIAIGSLIALPLAGSIVHRLGAAPRRVPPVHRVHGGHRRRRGGSDWSRCPVVAVARSSPGFGNGTWDVAMNVEAAAVEQQLGRSDHVALPRRRSASARWPAR